MKALGFARAAAAPVECRQDCWTSTADVWQPGRQMSNSDAPGAAPELQRLLADPVIEVYKKDVDRTLLRENLKRSVTERFERLMALQRFAEELRRAGRAAQDRK